MTSFSLFSNSSTARTLYDHEDGIIGRGVSLIVNSIYAVSMPGDGSSLLVGGLLAGTNIGATASRSATISVDAQGSILGSGFSGSGMSFSGYGNRDISNAGVIAGSRGIYQSSITAFTGGVAPVTSYDLLNSGTIEGRTDYGVRLIILDGLANVINSGTILGADYGVEINVASTSTTEESNLDNSGTIIGGEVGYTSVAISQVVRNSGTISGEDASIETFEGADMVYNTGELIGDVFLDDGNDRFYGRLGRVEGEVFGGAGDDLLVGGNDGADMSGGADSDTLRGGTGNDTLNGGAGTDTLRGRQGDDEVFGDDGDDLIFGARGDDSMYGGDNNDLLSGGVGDDFLFGGIGIDTLFGGAGDDTLDGAGWNDILRGGAGDDELRDSGGDDTMHGGKGDDTMTGGPGQDVFVYKRGDDIDEVTDFTDGDDRLDLRSWGFTNFLDVQNQHDVTETTEGVEIDFGRGDHLTLTGVTLAQLSFPDFLF